MRNSSPGVASAQCRDLPEASAVGATYARIMWLIGSLAVICLALVPQVKWPAWIGVGFNVAFGALITASVLGADTYANDGRSRWATRGDGAHAFYLVAMALVVASLVAFTVLAARGTRGRIVRPALALSGALD